MKLAVFTDEVSQDLETALKLAVRYGLDGVELRTVWDRPVQHLTFDEVARIRGLLEEHELRVAAIASPVFNCAHLCKELGTNIIRLFTFWKRGPSQPVWERMKKQFRAAVPIAEDAGVILGIENEASTYCATAAETQRFVAEMGSPAVKVVWDPCNEVFAEDGVVPYPDGYRVVEGSIAHVHVKDAEKG